jgi:hypothetical protein
MVSTSKAGTWLANGERALAYAVGADHDCKKTVMNFPDVTSAKPCSLGTPDMSMHVLMALRRPWQRLFILNAFYKFKMNLKRT